MTRSYIRLDPAFIEHKEAYPDGPYAALVDVFCLAEQQPARGRFRNERYLRALLGRRGRHVPYLLEHQDLKPLADGRLYVDGWDEWQEGDWKVGERVERIRGRSKGHVTADVTPPVTPGVTVGTESPGRLDLSDGVAKQGEARRSADGAPLTNGTVKMTTPTGPRVLSPGELSTKRNIHNDGGHNLEPDPDCPRCQTLGTSLS